MAGSGDPAKPVSQFYSYSHRDEDLRLKLETHLAVLRRGGLIAEWHDRKIEAGDAWKDQIDHHLTSADIVLLLVSSDFIASDYCWGEEMTKALERHERGEARVIPVILRHCRWRSTPLAYLQAVPKDAKPIKSWSDEDEAFDDVVTAIERAVQTARQKALTAQAPPAPSRERSGTPTAKVDREAVSTSFSQFAKHLLIGLSKKPGESQNLKELAESNNLRYEKGWIARTYEYLNAKGLITARSRRHLQSGPDDDYYGIITGIGLAEAEELQAYSGKTTGKPSREAGVEIGVGTTARRRIFLAHAREDKPQVRKLYGDLKAQGFDPWLDEVDLLPGQIWKNEIPKLIREAEICLACLSSRSVKKVGYVQNEFRLALSAFGERPPESIYLVPVRLDECTVPDLQIPERGLGLRDFHWVDLWQEDGLGRLVAAIEHALGKRAKSLP